MIGVIGGSGVLEADLFPKSKPRVVTTPYGKVTIHTQDSVFFIQRHGKDMPPHVINHKAHIQALKNVGVKYIIAVASVGSLKEDIRPGDLVIIDDYMQLSDIPTFYDDQMKFTKPFISETLRKRVIDAARALKIDIHTRGIYIQTKGRRYETKAEISMFKNFADVVGMTIASEATLANEAGIEYTVICSADNYAHGLVGEEISWGAIKNNQKKSHRKIGLLLNKVLEELR